MQAIIHHHRRVRFLSTIELVNALEQEKLNGKQGRLANRMTHVDLVILDELGYLPFSQTGGALAVPLPQQALREDQPDHHHQPELCGMAHRLRRCQADHRTSGSADAPLPHPRDRQRQLPTEELNQQSKGNERKEKDQNLSHNQANRVGQYSVQINSAEFQSRFHWHTESLDIRHVYIRPRSPHLNGKVERSHRIDEQEFYQMIDQNGISDDIHLFNEKVREWEDYYNYHRPHGALQGRTPYERLIEKSRADVSQGS